MVPWKILKFEVAKDVISCTLGAKQDESSTPLLEIFLLKRTFQDSVANLYYDLPASISSIPDYCHFVKESARILKAKAIVQLGQFPYLVIS